MRAAVELADDEGLGALSMRALAARAGVATMSLYRHVSGRADLISAMVDAVLVEAHGLARDRAGGGAGGSGEGLGWREALEREARAEWSLYREHPWALGALGTSRPPLGPQLIAVVDRYLAALAGRGVDPATGLSVFLLVSGYVQGMALLLVSESEQARDTGVSGPQWWGARGKWAEAVDYPWVRELAAGAAPGERDLNEWFDFGLARVLDGIALQVES
ncbi:transcriptional regulator, TetR family [Actinosynnema pretiosum subsp. pretiosum]|nr:transcriptional regulator, TetR family [Actinosynnema pretiosum subsp. pretiosum]